jgi:hypothetical protein
MGTVYKPKDARRRHSKDRALQDLDPSIREPATNLIEKDNRDDPENKPTKLLRPKKRQDLIDK